MGVGKTSYGPCRKVPREDPLSGSSILVLVDTVAEGEETWRNYAAMALSPITLIISRYLGRIYHLVTTPFIPSALARHCHTETR
jgi:hypothetical protein